MVIASVPSQSMRQNAVGESALGNRHAMPTRAIGSSGDIATMGACASGSSSLSRKAANRFKVGWSQSNVAGNARPDRSAISTAIEAAVREVSP